MDSTVKSAFGAAVETLRCDIPGRASFLEFVEATCERHQVHVAPWTLAFILDFCAALDIYSIAVDGHSVDDAMKAGKWLRDAAAALQHSFIEAGTPAPSGPAELYKILLAAGFRPLPSTDGPTAEDAPPGAKEGAS